MNIYFRNLLFISFLSFFSCRNLPHQSKSYLYIAGETMGTTYNIKYRGDVNYQKEIDDELMRINNELSTYIPTSTISRFNQSDNGIIVPQTDFYINFIKAKEIFQLFDGRYDVTIMPLVNYWGFGYSEHKKVTTIDTALILHLKDLVNMSNIEIKSESRDSIFLYKPKKEIQLDFSSLAKGYGVDKIAELIEKKGINDFMVEIGGEIFANGVNDKGNKWVIGINTPSEEAGIDDLIEEVDISGSGLATSGNYRNFYESNGQKFSHTINPKTGFPERSNLLSTTVLAKDCMTADALATAFMVSGLETSKKMLSKIKDIEVCFIYVDDSGQLSIFKSNGFDEKKIK